MTDWAKTETREVHRGSYGSAAGQLNREDVGDSGDPAIGIELDHVRATRRRRRIAARTGPGESLRHRRRVGLW